MVNPHDKTVLARDLQIPEELEDAPILDGDIVVPDFDDAAPQPELERLSIPELERISIPTLHADTERPPAPLVPPQAAVPDLAPVPSLPAGPRRPASSAGGRAVASNPQANAVDSLGPPAPRSKPRPVQGAVQGPVEFDDEFESFNAEGLTGVQAQLLETVQVREEQSQLPWPTGNSPDYQAIMIDPIDARVRGNFGAVPRSPVQAPQYAIAVFRRVRELKAEFAASKARGIAAETRRDQALAQLAQGCRSLQGDERFRHFFSNLEQLEQLVKERSQALAGDNQQYAEECAKIDQVIAANQAQINAMNAELITRSQKLSEQQQLLTRTEGMYKRLLIEIRSLKSAEEEGRIQGKPVDHSARIAALMEQVPNHQAAVAKRTADRSAVQAHVDAARKEVDRFAEDGRRLNKQKAEFEKAFRQRLGVRSQGVEEAEKEILAEGAHIARGLLSQRGGIAIPEEALDAVRTADAEVLREMKTQRLLEMALTAYDHDCYKQGRNFIIAAVVVVVMLIVMKIVGSHQSDESDDSSSESSRITCVELQRPV